MQEIDREVPTGDVTAEYLARMPYVEACVKETLRLYTPAPVLARQLAEDTVIQGRTFPKGIGRWCGYTLRLFPAPCVPKQNMTDSSTWSPLCLPSQLFIYQWPLGKFLSCSKIRKLMNHLPMVQLHWQTMAVMINRLDSLSFWQIWQTQEAQRTERSPLMFLG